MSDENLPRPLHITALTNGAARVRDERLRYPSKSTIAGPLRVIPRELPGVTCAALDIVLPEVPKLGFFGQAKAQNALDQSLNSLAERILEDLLAEPSNTNAALRADSAGSSRRYAP